jgi:hypothetical protein
MIKKMVQIDMKKYIDGCLEEFKEDVPGMVYKKVATLASEYLFQVCEMNGMKIPVERAKDFHCTVAKLIFVAKQGQPDILLAISFLTTRVKQPDEDVGRNCVEC